MPILRQEVAVLFAVPTEAHTGKLSDSERSIVGDHYLHNCTAPC